MWSTPCAFRTRTSTSCSQLSSLSARCALSSCSSSRAPPPTLPAGFSHVQQTLGSRMCRIPCVMLCESCTNVCTSNTHVLNGNIITLSITYSSPVQNTEFDFRLQKAVSCFSKKRSLSMHSMYTFEAVLTLPRSFPKILEASKMRISLRRCIHSPRPLRIQLEFRLRLQFCSQHPVSTFHCRIRVH